MSTEMRVIRPGGRTPSVPIQAFLRVPLFVLAALFAPLAGCSGGPSDVYQRMGQPPSGKEVEILSLTLNSSAITGVGRWRLDEKSVAPHPEWKKTSSRSPSPTCCAAVYLVTPDPLEIDVACEIAAPDGFLRAEFLTTSALSLGMSEVVAVGPRTVRSGLPFMHARLSHVGAADGDLVFSYGVTREGPFTEFSRIPCRIYTILGTPTTPWAALVDSEGNVHAPWLRALAVAVHWAEGAKTRDEAAARITRSIFALGRGPAPRLKWEGGQSRFCTNYSLLPSMNAFTLDCFYLSEFLSSLEEEGRAPQDVNCADIASAVCALANLLGCDLSVVTLGIDRALTAKTRFKVGPVWPLGTGSRSDGLELSSHQVAWSGSLSRNGLVYDACMALDVAGLPAPACGLEFGDVRDKDCYISRLSGDAPFLILIGSQRRPIAPLGVQELPRRPFGSR